MFDKKDFNCSVLLQIQAYVNHYAFISKAESPDKMPPDDQNTRGTGYFVYLKWSGSSNIKEKA